MIMMIDKYIHISKNNCFRKEYRSCRTQKKERKKKEIRKEERKEIEIKKEKRE